MKKTLVFLSIVLVILLGGFGIFRYNNPDFIPVNGPKVQSPAADLAFAVLGDVHGNTASLQKAISDLLAINQGMDALILNGDTVDQGIEKQYNSVIKVLLRNRAILPKTIIKNIGNHEFFDYDGGKNSPEQLQVQINRYLDFAGEKRVYHDTWIKGYHFISLGSEDGNSKTNDSVRAYISPSQMQWLKDTLSKDYEKGKPIFVFLHQHLNSNPNTGWVGTDQAEAIRKILASYPEAILFTSHTHADLTENSVLFNQPFTMVHTGAVHYTLVRSTQGSSTREPYIKGIYVEVNGNSVVIRGRDFKNKSWIFSKTVATVKK